MNAGPPLSGPTRGMVRARGDLFELRSEPDDPSLSNADLAPTRIGQRTWDTYHFASLWVGLSVCIPTYMLAAGLVGGGMSWSQALVTILLGNVIVCNLSLADLYTKGGVYGRWNPKALVALAAGVVVALVGRFVPALAALYSYAWFVGFFVAFAVYCLLMRGTPVVDLEAVPVVEEAP